MRYGRSLPDGFMPVFSVGTEAEAQRLLVLSCPRNMQGEFVAAELAQEQTLENLQAFSDRLEVMHQILVSNGQCDCGGRHD